MLHIFSLPKYGNSLVRMMCSLVAQELGISKSHAYKVIHKLNAELRDKGYLTIAGRVNRNFFMEKFCYGKTEKEG